ncbi:hypothetical protein ACNJ7E_33690 [Rhodococcus sp. NM-2]|uniref:hypothetical protein n=1 Tax=Rhodococcus TaxID=1827 RepID=UPI00247582D3|nr:hypothetical protein [Rhodococcus opacus]
MRTLDVAAVELDIRVGDIDHNVECIRDGVARGVAAGARLIVLPELATSFSARHGPTFERDASAVPDHDQTCHRFAAIQGHLLRRFGPRRVEGQHPRGSLVDPITTIATP